MTCSDARKHTLAQVSREWDKIAAQAEADKDEMASRWRRVADRAACALDRYRDSAEELD